MKGKQEGFFELVNLKVVLEEINVLKCMGLIARALKVIVNNGLFDVIYSFIVTVASISTRRIRNLYEKSLLHEPVFCKLDTKKLILICFFSPK